MTSAGDRRQRVRSLIEAEADGEDEVSPSGAPVPRTRLQRRLRRTCRAAARGLEADGAGVCLWAGTAGLMTAAASDERFLAVEDLQFVVGEGPCLTAHRERAPVLLPDLRAAGSAAGSTAWSTYPRAALELGVHAVFAFPLQVGEARLGVLDVYRDEPGTLTPALLDLGLTFAEVTFLDLLDDVAETDADSEAAGDLLDSVAANRYEVYQAQGMLMVQLGVSAPEALVRLRAHAFAHDVPLAQLARDVVQHGVDIEGHDENSD